MGEARSAERTPGQRAATAHAAPAGRAAHAAPAGRAAHAGRAARASRCAAPIGP